MFWLIRYEAFPEWFTHSLSGYDDLLGRDTLISDSWMRVIQDGKPVGYSHSSVDVDDDSALRHIIYDNRTHVRLEVMGHSQLIQAVASAYLDMSYRMQQFEFSMHTGVIDVELTGKRAEDDWFDLRIVTAGTVRTMRIEIPDDVMIQSPMTVMAVRRLKVGEYINIRTLNPLTLSRETAIVRAVAKEMIDECNESGTFITLPFVPLSINVELFFDRDDDTEEQKRANEQARFNWKSLRILDNNFPNKLIVPICHYTMNQNQGYSMYLRSKTMHLVKVKQIPYIPLYLTFAITSLKAQSRTMPRVILSLVPDGVKNQMKMTYNEFNVNISRAQGSIDNIRFLLPEGKTHNSLTSITKLKFKAPIVNLINAFQYENTQNTSMSTTGTNQNNTSDEYCIKTFNKEKYK